jgi:hypothetical protein
MTVVSIGEKTRCPQAVDSTWGRAANPWGRRCGSTRGVTGPSTSRVPRLSTEVPQSPWITRGRRGGQRSESSYRRPTVDDEAVSGTGLPLLIHRVTGHLTGPNRSFPQSPQHLRRRLVIPYLKSKTTLALWTWAADGLPKDMAGASVPRQVRIKPSSQEASNEVPG